MYARTARSFTPAIRTIQRNQSTNAAAESSGRSSALPVALALGAAVGAVLLYTKGKTGSADNVAKAMAKSGTPANTSGGLGRMDADHTLKMGGPEVTSEPKDKTPPSNRK